MESSSTAHAATPLSLKDAIAMAKARRSETAQAEIDRKIADVELLRAGLMRAHLTVEGHYTEGIQQANFGAPASICAQFPGYCNVSAHERLVIGTATLTVPIWSGMSVEASWSRARALQDAADAGRRAAWRSVALDAATAYWAVRRAELTLEANKKAYARSYQVVLVTKARTDAGVAPAVDYTRARASLSALEATINDLQGRSTQARAQLAAALQVNDEIELTEDPGDTSTSLPPVADVLAEAKRRRPELQAAAANIEAQEEEERVTKGAFWPQLSLVGSADARNQFLGVPVTNVIGNVSAGLQVDWQIFDSLSTYTQMRQEQLTRDRLMEERKRLWYTVRADVLSSYGAFEAAVQRTRPLRDALEAAQSGVEIIRRRYEAGTALLIEVLQAQDELQQVELSTVDNAIDIAQLRVSLDAARGAL